MKTLIISYPRSGNSFTRYIVEFLTGRPTKDAMAKKIVSREQKAMIHQGDNYVAYKRHDWNGVTDEDRVVFILRNYKECLVRHNRGKRELTKEFMLNQANGDSSTYCGLLKRFDEHRGEKLLLYYEDLISGTSKISDLRDFFNVGDTMYQLYVDNASEHAKNSLKCYPKSQTGGIGAINHSNELTKWVKIAMDNLFKKHQKKLFNKYLTRYQEKK